MKLILMLSKKILIALETITLLTPFLAVHS